MHKQKKNKRSRGRKSRRQHGGSVLTRRAPLSGDFVPAEFKTSLALSGTVENATSTTYAESGFTMNDLFDPQGGSGAAQCPGFDQLALLYARYRVHRTKIQVRASLNSINATPTATALEAQIVVYPSTVSAGATTVADGQSQPMAKTFFISGEMPKSVSMTIDIRKFIGNTVSADRLQAAVSSSPAKILYWHIGVVSRAYTSISTTLQVRVTYDCDFFERALLDRSALDLVHKVKLETDKYRSEAESKRPSFTNWTKTESKTPASDKECKSLLLADDPGYWADDDVSPRKEEKPVIGKSTDCKVS